jgi:hypothetical protein
MLAGESLLRRLPGQLDLVDRLLTAAQAGSQQQQQQPAPCTPSQRLPLPVSEGAAVERPASAPPLQHAVTPAGDAEAERRTPASAPGSAPGSVSGSAPGSAPGSAAGSPPTSRASSQELLRPMSGVETLQQLDAQHGSAGEQRAALQPPAAQGRGVDVAAPAEREAIVQLMHGGHGGGSFDDNADWGDCLESETVIQVAPPQQRPAPDQPPHRFYVQVTPTSMRLATVVVSED